VANPILIEGYAPDEILAFSNEQIDAFVFAGEPLVFKIGSATILGEFRRSADTLTLELAQIDGGGEGVLPTLWTLANRYALANQLTYVEWVVHAINCAKPNLKLRRILGKMGFTIQDVPGIGEAYYLRVKLNANP
jgi:hypothetical protein